MNPETVGPMIGEKLKTTPMIPMTAPRCFASAARMAITLTNGIMTPAPIAWIIRPMIKIKYWLASVPIKEPVKKMIEKVKKRFLNENFFIKNALVGIIKALANIYPLVSH